MSVYVWSWSKTILELYLYENLRILSTKYFLDYIYFYLQLFMIYLTYFYLRWVFFLILSQHLFLSIPSRGQNNHLTSSFRFYFHSKKIFSATNLSSFCNFATRLKLHKRSKLLTSEILSNAAESSGGLQSVLIWPCLRVFFIILQSPSTNESI